MTDTLWLARDFARKLRYLDGETQGAVERLLVSEWIYAPSTARRAAAAVFSEPSPWGVR